MGLGSSLPKSPFDYFEENEKVGNISSRLVSYSTFYCLVQQTAEWPNFYFLLDCRPIKQYSRCHIVGAKHYEEFNVTKANDLTICLYGTKKNAEPIMNILNNMDKADATPVNVYVLNGSFKGFKKRYVVVTSTFEQTKEELPGPIELAPATKQTPAIYFTHRKQFHYCKSTIAQLGCSSILNISSRRLYLKHGSIQLENVQFDGVNEPYDEAVEMLNRLANKKPKSPKINNVLIINETGSNYATLLVGWWWYKRGFNLEEICEVLQIKTANLDQWYLDVLRAWVETDENSDDKVEMSPDN